MVAYTVSYELINNSTYVKDMEENEIFLTLHRLCTMMIRTGSAFGVD
jgi:hypothetical protein